MIARQVESLLERRGEIGFVGSTLLNQVLGYMKSSMIPVLLVPGTYGN